MSAASPIALVRDKIGRMIRNEAGATLFAFTAATILLRLGSNVVLTRLLDPHAFGVVGVIISVIIVLTMIADIGVIDFVLRHPRGGERRFLDVLWTIRLVQCGLQALTMAITAWPVALFLGKPELAVPIAITAPLFIVNALSPMSLLLAQREGKVRLVCSIELIALAIQIAVNLALSLVMPDYRALVIGLYVGSFARMLLPLVMMKGGLHFAWDRGVAGEFFGFSRWIVPATILTLLISQSDKLLFARLFTVADFGVYMLPVNLSVALQPFGHNYIDRYFYPLVSRTWNEAPERLGDVFYAVRRRLYLLLFAGIGFGIGVAPALFRLLFDHRYEYGWIYLSVLLLRIAFDLDSWTTIKAMVAMGHSRTILIANLLKLAIFAATVAASYAALGPISLPLALAASELAALLYTFAILAPTGLFRPREHALYLGTLGLMAGIGAAISLWAAPDVIRAGWALVG